MQILTSILGIIGLVFLACFVIWFVAHPISRDKVLAKFGKWYFLLLLCIMVSSVCVIAMAIKPTPSLEHCSQNTTSNLHDSRWAIAVQYSVRMASPDKSDLGLSLFVMIFQMLVFESLILAAIVGWTSRRINRFQSGEVRYPTWAFNGRFVSLCDGKGRNTRNTFAVVIGANEVAPSVIKNLLMHETAKDGALNYAHEKENQYVILQTSQPVETVRQSLQALLTEEEYDRVIIYNDLRNSYEGLMALHLENASEIYILGENTAIDGGENFHDTLNMRCVNLVANILRVKGTEKKVCKVLFEYQTTYSVFQFSDVPQNVKDTMIYIPFNRYESWARRVMVDNMAKVMVDEISPQADLNHTEHSIRYTPLDGYDGIGVSSHKRVHFIVVGMSKMGIAMGVQALFQAHYPNYVRDHTLKSRITFIDTNADQEMQFFKGRYATLFELARHRYVDANKCDIRHLNIHEETHLVDDATDYKWINPMGDPSYKWAHLSKDAQNFLDVELEFVKGELELENVREYLRQVTNDSNSKVTIAICLPMTHQAMAAALYMPIEVYSAAQEIWVYQREAADIIQNLTQSRDNNLRYKKLRPFGMLYGEYIDCRTHYLKALLVNSVYDMDGDTYKANERDMGNKSTYKDLRTKWNNLSVAQQWSNKYFSDLMYQKMRSIVPNLSPEAAVGGYANKYLFENESWKNNFEDALLSNEDLLARCEHNRWNIQQLLMGFTPCMSEDDQCMCEFVKRGMTTELKSKKESLKQSAEKIHPNICDFEHLTQVDPGAKAYDSKLNNQIPTILTHVDGYKCSTWYTMKSNNA